MARSIHKPPARFIGGKSGSAAISTAIDAVGIGYDLALDLFGDGGTLSRAVKDRGTATRVVYGDYDNYSARVQYMQSGAFALDYATVRDLLQGVPRDSRIPASTVELVATALPLWRDEVAAVWLPYLSFTGKDSAVRDLCSIGRYNRVPSRMPNAAGWLDGLEVVTGVDARELAMRYLPTRERTLVIVDPPYPGTHGASHVDSSWSLADYERLLFDLAGYGADTLLCFGDDRSGVRAMMQRIAPQAQVIEFGIRTNGTAVGSTDAAYIIRKP